MDLVVDASVAVAWCAPRQATELTKRALRSAAEHGMLVAGHFFAELGYALLRLERRKLLQPDRINRFIGRLETLSVTADTEVLASPVSLARAINEARQHSLSIFDAAYLNLALRTGAVLATRDRALARAAERAGVRLFTA